MKNYGFVQPKIEADQYIFGASPLSGIVDLLPSGDWRPYLPKYEPQLLPSGEDESGCTVWGGQNQLEILLKFLYGVEHNFDEQYNYNIIGIEPPGADPQLYYESQRKQFLTEGAFPPAQTLEEFKKPRPMTQNYLDEGKKFPYNVGHEWLFTNNPTKEVRLNMLKTGLRKCPVAISVTAWMQDRNGLYIDNSLSNTHWCVCVAIEGDSPIVFDSYDQSIKKLHPDHNIQVAKLIYVSEKLPEQPSLIQRILTLVGQALGLIQKQVNELPKPINQPVNVYKEVKEEAMKNKLDEFCLAIRDYEGKPGDLNYKNNNPGNAKFSTSGYRPIYGTVKKDKRGFAIFESYEKGWLYLQNLVKSKIGSHPEWTVIDFFENYAPSSDNNNPYKYASYVATRVGIKEYDKVSKIMV